MTARDTRPVFDSTPRPYAGPVPIVTHVHGRSACGDESDGYAEAWFLPGAMNIPDGYAKMGTWYSFFATRLARSAAPWGLGTRLHLPQPQPPSTIWYHDHTIGMTRLNVYARAGRFLRRARRPGRHGPRHAHGGAAVYRTRPEGGRRVPPNKTTSRSRSRSRTAPSTPTARCSTPTRGPSSTGSPGPYLPTRRRRDGLLADLEPGVLREHHDGQRATPGRSWTSSSAATGSGSSTAAIRAS